MSGPLASFPKKARKTVKSKTERMGSASPLKISTKYPIAVKEITIAAKGAKPPESWLVTEAKTITPALKRMEADKSSFLFLLFSPSLNITSEIPYCKSISVRKNKKLSGSKSPKKVAETAARTMFLNFFGAALKKISAAGRKRYKNAGNAGSN